MRCFLICEGIQMNTDTCLTFFLSIFPDHFAFALRWHDSTHLPFIYCTFPSPSLPNSSHPLRFSSEITSLEKIS